MYLCTHDDNHTHRTAILAPQIILQNSLICLYMKMVEDGFLYRERKLNFFPGYVYVCSVERLRI